MKIHVRILSTLLAFILLLGLLPLGVSAAEGTADFKASAELVEVIKKWEGFAKYPVWDYGQYSVGYGTRAPDEHLARYRAEGISEEEATQLLEGYMNSMGTSVNSFINKHHLKATQGQFDAMLSLTYNCGPRWMLEVSTLRTSILDGWKGSDFIFAFGQWSTAGGSTLLGLVRRRLAEANMYLNGEYSTALPANYCYVQFNANGGTSEIITQGYDSNEAPVAIRAVPVRQNYTFQGWYTDSTGGEKVEKLDASVKGYTLYAHWRAGNGQPSDTTETVTGTPVSYTRQINALSLNVFDQPLKGAMVVDSLEEGEIVDIIAEYNDTEGVKWGKVKNVGWINLSYTQEPTEEEENEGVTVKVKGIGVNIRRGPGTTYAAVGTANTGDELVITRTTTAGGYVWGKFSKGWIALKYTNYDDVVNGKIEEEKPTQTKITGVTNVNDFLRIRSGPGVGNSVLGTLGPKERVEILEQRAVGGTIWGRIDRGWISMDYIILDKVNEDPKPEESKPEETVPEETKPEETVPEETVPEETIPEETKPEETVPEETVPEAPKPEENKPDNKGLTGKVKLQSGYLNVRSGASTAYPVIDKYANGSAVTILEQKTVGAVTWGKTEKGWISMDYVKLDPVAEPEEPKVEETKPEETKPEETKPEEIKPEETKPEETVPQEKPQTTTISGVVSISSGCLRIRSGAGTGYKIVGNLYNGNKVTITEKKTVNGVQWGKISNGWICLDYVKTTEVPSGTGSSTTTQTLTGTVNVNEFLRIRSGAGTNYSLVGYYYPNNKVTITETKTVGGTKWGKTDRGWISMDYIIVDGEGNKQETAKPDTIAGTVVLTSGILRIRGGAGTGYKIVGSLSNGAKVTILETKTVSGTKWGRVAQGWVCMDYIKTN